MRYVLFAFVLALTFVPQAASAASVDFFGPIVPAACHCDQVTGPGGTSDSAPQYGCVLQVIQNVIRFAVSLGIVIATLALVYAGFVWMTSRGKPEQISQGRNLLINVFIGLAVLLGAWLLVDFVMKTLYREPTEFGPWNSILAANGDSAAVCIAPQKSLELSAGSAKLYTNDLSSGAGGSSPAGTSNGTGGTVSGGSGKSGLNVQGATSYARSHAKSAPTGECALFVRQALGNGGGLKTFSGGVGNAYEFGGPLQRAGFVQVYSSTYDPAASENLSGVQKGDVVVFQKVAGHPYGHVAIYDGSNWVSDYVQRTMSSNPAQYKGGSYTIYRP